MDWGILFAGAAAGLTLVGTISSFVYLIMKLITKPMQEDLVELSLTVKEMNGKLKSEPDLIRLIQSEVIKHEKSCPGRLYTQSQGFINTETSSVLTKVKG